MRLPYVQNPPQTSTPEDVEILPRVQSRRGPGPLQSIDLVPKETFDRLRQWLNNRQMVEITATVAALNCAARFLVALNVGEFDHHD
jgi:hypothetical protein